MQVLWFQFISLTSFFVQTFYNAAFKKVQRVTERYRKMEEVYAQVCTLFGENPRVVEPSDFFKTFIDFIANYKVHRELKLVLRAIALRFYLHGEFNPNNVKYS